MATKVLRLVELQRKLERLPAVAVQEIRAAMEGAANEIVEMAKRLVPVGSGPSAGSKKVSRHGALRDSIGWTWGAPPRGSITVGKLLGSGLGKGLTLTIFAGNETAYYARWVEFGTAAHKAGGKFKGADHPGGTAKPFFFVSYRASRKSAKRKVRAGIRKAAKKVAASR